MKPLKAIVAMSQNRVIGANNKLPWHIPEELKWFKALTMGHALVMGRKTYESIGRPLPGRLNYVLSRSGFSAPGVVSIQSLTELESVPAEREIFVIGGAQIFEAAFPLCGELFLTVVKREVEGDTLMPPFEHLFTRGELLRESAEFEVHRWVRK
ncbi:MAG TPA: dihydrofolate reductase [Methylomirabilota bacterium]|nr:dihydrofolate reductase [Methylomirabilota bacterium]